MSEFFTLLIGLGLGTIVTALAMNAREERIREDAFADGVLHEAMRHSTSVDWEELSPLPWDDSQEDDEWGVGDWSRL